MYTFDIAYIMVVKNMVGSYYCIAELLVEFMIYEVYWIVGAESFDLFC
jgi:hypothetical protein